MGHGDRCGGLLHVGSGAGDIGMPPSGVFAGVAEYDIDLSFRISGGWRGLVYAAGVLLLP